ncbi:hypothetical protein PLESTB_001243300 [Pleodorina starrii]|uniref:RING-type domain-containing protein n=1 Tax=Pleodorina starrii TaxID=330485 RepID=A0A9W6F6J3_9CHLO|nr:hypothetical protein PLESTM_000216500 [Pleodorina starrii]GLC57586.1 hypothetical protein PLESTB_001243300 [Pleodorina starrii]GLC63256.1 hypothetical protein PLESTF_000017100 [Pleodorina starrii]
MLVFFFSSGQGGSFSVGPLIALLPLLLQLAPFFLQDAPSTGSWRLPSVDDALRLIGTLALFAAGIVCFVRWVRRNGGWRFVLQLLLQGYQGGPAGGAGGAQGQGGHGRAQQPHGRARARITVEEVTEALMKLPTESYMTSEQLAGLPVHDLKELIRGRGLEPIKCLEKEELVRQLLEHGGSSAHSCSICCEDYTAGSSISPDAGEGSSGAGGGAADADVLRVLRCGHRFHVECVDRWFLSSTEYTRAPACPLCNAPLLQPQAADPKAAEARR